MFRNPDGSYDMEQVDAFYELIAKSNMKWYQGEYRFAIFQLVWHFPIKEWGLAINLCWYGIQIELLFFNFGIWWTSWEKPRREW